jgi:hypothetical protein
MNHLLVAVGAFAVLAGLPAQARLPSAQLPPSPDGAADATILAAKAAHARLGAGIREVQFAQPVADGPLWALGSAWKASFDATGTTVIPYFGSTAPRNFPLRLQLATATVGGEPLALRPGVPTQAGASVRTDRGSLTEVIDTRLDQLEQSFVFDELPNRGAIAVDVAMSSELAMRPIPGGLRFANEHGHIDYVKALAVDAAGRRLPLDIQWTGSAARIEIPAAFVAEAQLPLVLDPVLNYWYALGSGTTQYQHDSDVAAIQNNGGRVLLVWQRQWSSTDQDCYGLMFDGNLGLVRTDFVIDFTSEDYLKVAVAGNNYANNFLVVAEIRTGLLWWIGGHLIDAAGNVGNLITIERELVVGTPGNNFHPDVGSDPYFGVGYYTVVWNKRTLTSSDICARQLSTAGGLRTTNAVQLTATTDEESKPSIGKSCGQSNGQPANFLVTWQKTWIGTPYDQEVWGIFYGWNGAVIGAPFPLAITPSEETAPSAGSPIDVDGVRLWPFAYEMAATLGVPRSVVCKVCNGSGSVVGTTTVDGPTPGLDNREPEIDSDGTRFLITRTAASGSLPAVEAVTFAFLPGNTFRVEERTGLVTSPTDSYGQTNVCAAFSGGSTMTPRYFVSFTELTNNTFRLAAFDGTAGSTGFSTRFTQCGATTISASGSSALGQSVTLSASGPGFTGMLFGLPGSSMIGPCGCISGVSQPLTMPGSFTWSVPANASFVGLPLSAQGFSLSGSSCYGFLDVSNTVDFTIN